MPIRYHFNPLDPMDPYTCDPHPPQDPDQDAVCGCLSTLTVPFLFVIIILICSLIVGCTTQKVVESQNTEHRVSDLMQRMDSFINSRVVIRQDSSFHESVLSFLRDIKEKTDTSRTLVVDSAGKVLKETLIIRTEKESVNTTDRREREVMTHRLEMMDSTLHRIQQQLSHSDSLLQQRQQTVERQVPAPLTWWQQMQLWLGRLVLVALAAALAVWLVRKRTWWPR